MTKEAQLLPIFVPLAGPDEREGERYLDIVSIGAPLTNGVRLDPSVPFLPDTDGYTVFTSRQALLPGGVTSRGLLLLRLDRSGHPRRGVWVAADGALPDTITVPLVTEMVRTLQRWALALSPTSPTSGWPQAKWLEVLGSNFGAFYEEKLERLSPPAQRQFLRSALASLTLGSPGGLIPPTWEVEAWQRRVRAAALKAASPSAPAGPRWPDDFLGTPPAPSDRSPVVQVATEASVTASTPRAMLRYLAAFLLVAAILPALLGARQQPL